MKQKLLTLLLGLFVAGITAQKAEAATISGAISFGGRVSLNGTVGSATAVTGWFNTEVEGSDGDFTGIADAGDAVTFNAPWSFETNSTLTNFWSVNGFTFDLLFSTVEFQTNNTVSVTGTGKIKHAGFEDTTGTWSFTSQRPGTGSSPVTFSFSASGEAVPEGGSALALLGVGLIGLCVVQKKLANRKTA